MDLKNSQIIFFDGVCNLCNASVDFLVRHDKQKIFLYASLQGETAKALLPPNERENLHSIVFYQAGQLSEQSSAVLAILSRLGFPWYLVAIFKPLPRPFRDLIYRLIARNRYFLFGRRNSCRLPLASEQSYLLP